MVLQEMMVMRAANTAAPASMLLLKSGVNQGSDLTLRR